MTNSRRVFRKATVTSPAVVACTALLALVLAGCGDGATIQATQGSTASGSLIDTIIVSGTGNTTTMPDEATIQVGVENEGATAAEALDANSKDTQKVLDRLKAEGVSEDDIETANVVVYPNYRYDQATGQEKMTGYRAQNTVTVTFTDFALIGDVYAAMTEAGADSVYGPNWQLSDNNAAVATALTKAIANARTKAEAIAQDQGVELGNALIISESSASVPYPLYADTMARAEEQAGGSVTPPPIIPQKMDVTAGVTVTYQMKR